MSVFTQIRWRRITTFVCALVVSSNILTASALPQVDDSTFPSDWSMRQLEVMVHLKDLGAAFREGEKGWEASLVKVSNAYDESFWAGSSNDLSSLAELPIYAVELAGDVVTDGDVEALSRLANITSLTVNARKSRVSSIALRRLGKMTNLQELVIGSPAADIDVLAQISANKSLGLICLMYCELTADGVRLLSRMPRLREVGLVSVQLNQDAFDELCKLVEIQALSLEYLDIRPLRTSGISSLGALKKLRLRGLKVPDDFFACVGNLRGLTSLTILKTKMVDRDFECVLPAVAGGAGTNGAVLELDLAETRIGDASVSILIDSSKFHMDAATIYLPTSVSEEAVKLLKSSRPKWRICRD